MQKKYLVIWLLVLVVVLSACAGNITPPSVQPIDSSVPSPQPSNPVPTPTPTVPNLDDYTDVVVSPEEIIIYPAPQGIYYEKENTYNIFTGKVYADNHIEANAWKSIEKVFGDYVSLDILQDSEKANITIVKNEDLNEQGYSLVINEQGISIEYKDGPGAYYAGITLNQILAQKYPQLPFLSIINDYPDMLSRGFSLDIARDKVPTLETLKGLVDTLSGLKMNLLSLYMEKSSMVIDELAYMQEGLISLTEAEMRELVDYAKIKYVEILPMHSLFGHMSDWLSDSRMAKLREIPANMYCSTICVQNPESQVFITKIIDSLVRSFDSEYIYIGGDETYEIGSEQSLAYLGKDTSAAKVYFDSLKIIYDILQSRGKKMIIAGDMLIKYYESHKELVHEYAALLPDMKVYVWGYSESTDFRNFSSIMVNLGLEFGVMPSTCVFGSVAGRLSTAEKNQENAIKFGLRYQTNSLLTTTWGDGGMRSALTAEYPALSYAGGMSWSYATNTKSVMDYTPYVRKFILQTEDVDFFNAYIKLQRFNDYSTQSYGQSWLVGIANKSYFDETFIKSYINLQNGSNKQAKYQECISQMDKIIADAKNLKTLTQSAVMNIENEETVKEEIILCSDIMILMAEYTKMRVELIAEYKTAAQLQETAAEVYSLGLDINERYRQLWLKVNKYSLIDASIAWLNIPIFLIGNIAEAYTPDQKGNHFLFTPNDIDKLAAEYFSVAYTWNSYGKGLPIINIAGGSTGYKDVVSICEDNSVKVLNNINGVSGKVFAINSTKLYDNREIAFIGWPLLTKGKTKLTITCKVKFGNGTAVNSTNVIASIVATKSDGLITLNGGSMNFSAPDNNDWTTVTYTIDNPNLYEYASWGIRPTLSSGDTLYIADLSMV